MKKIILRITTEVNKSSIGRTVEQLGNLVIENGWESIIAYGRSENGSSSQLIKIGNKLTLLIHCLLTRFLDMHGLGSIIPTYLLIKKIKSIKPDIIHLHDIHGYYINYKILFRYLSISKTPVIWTHHDCWAFTGHCGIYAECDKWKVHCNKCPSYKIYPRSIFFDGSSRNFNYKKKSFTSLEHLCNVGVSQWICDELKQSFLKEQPIVRIYNGIDTLVFKPTPQYNYEIREKYNLGDGIILIALATAWTEGKGLSDYLSLRKILDKKYTIVFVGTPKILKESLPEGILGISRTDTMDELVKLYSTSSIVMNLSHGESFGKTTPEGLACGVPSIVYNCTASPELVDDKTGIVVDKGDIIGVKNAVEEILKWDKDVTLHNCRNRACELFSIEKNWPKYIELYKEIFNDTK